MVRLQRVLGWMAAMCTVAAGAGAFAVPAFASEGPSPPGLQPLQAGPDGYFEAILPPGATRTFAVVVKNLSDTTAAYRVYPADGTTSAVTGVEYSQANTTPTATGSWISVTGAQVTLAPGASQTVRFTVSVPADAGPGDHVAAVASDSPTSGQAQSQSSNGSPTNVALSVTSRVVVAVVIHVPGPSTVALQVGQPSFGIESGGRQTLNIPLNDTGDVLFKPHLSGTIAPCKATAPSVVIDRQLDTFVPHTAIDYAYHLLNVQLPEGCYSVDLKADYPGGPLSAFHGTLQLGPSAVASGPAGNRGAGTNRGSSGNHSSSSAVLALAVIVGVLGVAVVILLLILWRRRRKPAPAPGDAEESGDRATV